MSIIYSGPALLKRPPTADLSPLTSLVIRTYNEAKYIEQVMIQAAVQVVPSGRGIKIIIIDSGSTDGTHEIAERHGALIKSIRKVEFTYGRSLDMGCEAASGEFLVMVSGHCIPTDEGWLENLLSPMRDPCVAMTYGRQIGGPSSKFSEARVFEKYYPDGPASQGEAFCNNANSAVRKSIWKRFRFDENLPGLEDVDIGRRIVAAGFRIDYCPHSVVTHIHNESCGQVRRRYEREAVALRHIFPEFHLTGLEAAFCFVSAVKKDAQAAFQSPRSAGVWCELLFYRYNQFLGSWLGSRPHRELSAKEKARYFFPS